MSCCICACIYIWRREEEAEGKVLARLGAQWLQHVLKSRGAAACVAREGEGYSLPHNSSKSAPPYTHVPVCLCLCVCARVRASLGRTLYVEHMGPMPTSISTKSRAAPASSLRSRSVPASSLSPVPSPSYTYVYEEGIYEHFEIVNESCKKMTPPRIKKKWKLESIYLEVFSVLNYYCTFPD